jgi:AcrR family transcriptional regulator
MAKSGETRLDRTRRASSARREWERVELRQTILEAAAELFLEKGYDQFSMRQIAERIGYSATTLYRHFRDKDELLFAVVDKAFLGFGEALTAAGTITDDPAADITNIGRAYIRFALEHPVHYRLMFMQRADYLYKSVEGSDSPRHDSFLVLERAVQRAIEAGAIKPGSARAYSNMLWALVHGLCSLAISMPHLDLFPGQDDIDAVLAVAFDGLSPR